MVRDVAELAGDNIDLERDQALFTTLARFYEWAGKTGRLEPTRAATIASVLAAAALPVAGSRMAS